MTREELIKQIFTKKTFLCVGLDTDIKKIPQHLLGGMEAESAKLCFNMVIFITITKPISWVLSFIPAYGMRAAGDVKFSMITSCCTMWLCRVSLCIYLCRVWGFGPIAVWIGMFADWSLRAIIFTIRFHSRKWLEHKVI